MSIMVTHSPRQNRILASLGTVELARLEDDLERVTLTGGQVIFEPGDHLAFIYFPTTCIISLIFSTENGSSAELAMTGNDGLVGIPLVLGGETTTYKMVVQSAGVAYRLPAEIMSWEIDQGGNLQRLSLRYAQALMTQMAQSVVCNRHHSVDKQLCRWLLLSLDQLPGNQIDITQELIGNMLGVRREAVTEAAGKLQTAGLIQYRRGHITVTDRPGLEARVCECYRVVKSEYDRLFNLNPATTAKHRARPNPATVRQRAEVRLQKMQRNTPPAATTAWDNSRLLHELQVHQVELEMHNEELCLAYDEADALREKFADIYDFAPVGYFTLNNLGVILQLNMAGAILLGIKRSQNKRHRFAASVKPAFLETFKNFHEEVMNGKSKKHCELELIAAEHRSEAVVRIEAVPDDDGNECRMVVMDITAEKTAQKALQDREQYLRALLDNFPFSVWLKNADDQYLAGNTTLVNTLGLPSPESLAGKTDYDILSPTSAARYVAEDQAVMSSGEKRHVEELIEVQGEQRWFETYKSAIVMEEQKLGTVGFARDITERKLMEAELERLAAIDPLTGLVTRTHFLVHLEKAYSIVKRDHHQHGVVLVLDIDYFKVLSDTVGQVVSDVMLRLVAALLRDELRQSDTAGRMDLNKFAVVLPISDLEAALVFAERVRQTIADTAIVVGARHGAVTLSIGIAMINPEEESGEVSLNRADAALARGKASGRNRIEVIPEQRALANRPPGPTGSF